MDVTVYKDFIGLTVSEIRRSDEAIIFKTTCGKVWAMWHEQDCCENVAIEEIIGDLQDLVGSPILEAEEVSNQSSLDYGSQTWTFYKLGTIKGHVNIRWLGESNGYYSEGVTFMPPNEWQIRGDLEALISTLNNE